MYRRRSGRCHSGVQPVTLDLLRKQPLFRRLTDDDRARVAAVAHLREHPRGDVLFTEGDDADVFMVVVAGQVKATPAGKEHPRAHHLLPH